MKNCAAIKRICIMAMAFAAVALLHGCKKPIEVKPEITIDGEASLSLDFGSQAGSKKITVKSNMDWSAAGFPDWITVVPSSGMEGTSTVLVTVTEPETGGTRNASFDFSINDTAKASLTVTSSLDPVLTVSPTSISVPVEGGEAKFTITANIPWSLDLKNAADRQYIENIPVTSGSGTQEITIVLKANETIDEIVIPLILVSTEEALSSIVPTEGYEIIITQAGDDVRLESSDDIVYASKLGGEVNFAVSSNIHWKLALDNAADSKYIESFSPSGGEGDAEISIVFKENTSLDVITFDMTLSSDDDRVSPSITRKISFSQANSIAELNVDNTTFNIPGDGGSATFNIVSNTAWRIYLPDEAQDEHIASISHPAGDGDRQVTVVFNANPEIVSTNVILRVESSEPSVVPQIVRDLTFTHAAGEVRLSVNVSELSVSGLGGSTQFTIDSNIDWKVGLQNASDQKYVESIEPASGTGDSKVVITVNENTMEDPLSFVITVTSDNTNVNPAIARNITIKQSAGVAPPAPTGITSEPQYDYATIKWSSMTRAEGYEVEFNGSVTTTDTNYCVLTGLEPNKSYSCRIRSFRHFLYSEWSDFTFYTQNAYPNSDWLGSWTGTMSSLRLRNGEFGSLNVYQLLSGTPGAVAMNISSHPSLDYKVRVKMSGGLSGLYPTSALSSMDVINAGSAISAIAASAERVEIPINMLITDITEILQKLTAEEKQAIIGIKLNNLIFTSKTVEYSAQLVGTTDSYVTLTSLGDVTTTLTGGDSGNRVQLANKIQELLKNTEFIMTIPMSK